MRPFPRVACVEHAGLLFDVDTRSWPPGTEAFRKEAASRLAAWLRSLPASTARRLHEDLASAPAALPALRPAELTASLREAAAASRAIVGAVTSCWDFRLHHACCILASRTPARAASSELQINACDV